MRKNRCVACKRKLDEPFVFADDFPDEWKLCCGCLRLAVHLISYSSERVSDFFLTNYKFFEKRSFLNRLERINNLINVN